jgi:hypothetical protein
VVEDVVVYRVTGRKIEDWGRDNLEVATEFCRRPKWPAKLDQQFVGADDYGRGTIVCATPELSNWIGKSMAQFRAEVH